ncbi:RNA-directed DNA polymerase, eukaryota, reverse transcriptase zinc-binding domain protein [Tanacetum coccineum]|uniref:RNA-directed DNA polymerase, eukaryota, reverse transcriptase zinc-binding domain protein n=1 Tax=Tanacetum coccineum TaxID=301880 RepID=A0ABQ5I464_9ASTR
MVGWIITCVTTTAFTISVNAERHEYFTSGRGLRQGEPISPSIFTLVMEVVSLILARNVEQSRVFKFHKGCKEMKLTHLSFVDDLLVLCHGDENSIKVIKDFVKENIKQRILEVLPFKIGKLSVKYLGIPLLAKRLGIKDRKCLVDKVKNEVLDWKNKFVSYVGIVQLIASILSSMQAYSEFVVKIPKTVVKDIDGALKSKEKNDSCTGKALLELRNKVRPFIVHIVDYLVADIIQNGSWNWPIEWSNHILNNILVPRLNENAKDQVAIAEFDCKSSQVCKVAREWNVVMKECNVCDKGCLG